jgi:hypothetical protein
MALALKYVSSAFKFQVQVHASALTFGVALGLQKMLESESSAGVRRSLRRHAHGTPIGASITLGR